MKPSVQIVGLVRFSFATIGAFYPGFETAEDMERFLFDPARLRRRFALFEAFCLPSLRQQTNTDFTCILLVGQGMPRDWKDRLFALTAEVPAIRIVEAPPQHHYSGIKQTLLDHPSDGHSHRITFRFDDDDALDNGFIARLHDYAPKLISLSGWDTPVVLSHNRGLYVERRHGRTVITANTERTPLSIGTALIAPASYPDNIYQLDHRLLAARFNTWSDTTHYSYLRTVHRDNKSTPKRTGEQPDLTQREIGQILKAGFGRKPAFFKHEAWAFDDAT